jgi:CheY-like chemotaxis protein
MQQERLRVLGQMASGVAHDINNALSPAALYAQSLLERDSSLSPKTREYLTLIQRAIDDVGRTVARLREFYRPRDLEVSLSAVALNVLLDQVAELTRARWSDIPQERGIVITLSKELAPDLPPVMGAENEIRDAFTNLVLNAVDAMPDGGVLTLRSTIQTPTNAYGDTKATPQVIVEIVDTGVGMSEAVRSRCFEPFFTTKGERGTGLGLGMVHGMAQRHSARIDLDSTPGMGTTVRVTFPVPAHEDRKQKPSPANAAARHLRVLLVDDDPLLLECLQAILQTDGHAVVCANGGQAGIDEYFAARSRGELFDIVMTDLGMPNVDGRTVAASIKSATPDMPVVLLTGWGQRLQGQTGQMEYVDRVLSKPPDLNELRTTLAELARRDLPALAARATS